MKELVTQVNQIWSAINNLQSAQNNANNNNPETIRSAGVASVGTVSDSVTVRMNVKNHNTFVRLRLAPNRTYASLRDKVQHHER